MKKIFRAIKRTIYLLMAALGLYFVIRELTDKRGILATKYKPVKSTLNTANLGDNQEIPLEEEPTNLQAEPENLKIIEGIGPKIQQILYAAGIHTYAKLSEQSVEQLESILKAAGIRLANPQTWPAQASYAKTGSLAELTKYQSTLKGGRISE